MAGLHHRPSSLFVLLNQTRDRVSAVVSGLQLLSAADGAGPGQRWPFGRGTVHHACGRLRRPWTANRLANVSDRCVVDRHLKLRDGSGLYDCDLSVLPISTAATPVLALAGLAPRLFHHLGGPPSAASRAAPRQG